MSFVMGIYVWVILMDTENYVYKKEVDWSLLTEGLTLPVENQVVFGRNMGRFLKRGEKRNIKMYLNGKMYEAYIRNVNFNSNYRRKDVMQIRYKKNGELAQALQACFRKSYLYFKAQREVREKGDRTIIRLPEKDKEYMAIYTTEYEDTYTLEIILADDILEFKNLVSEMDERIAEKRFIYNIYDEDTSIIESEGTTKIRKLNRKIGENLKLLYGYKCQICGKKIGEEYGSSGVVEAHHIDYFVKSLNNDASNQIIICPNHHSIIHDVNPKFERKSLIYIYPNGYKEGLILNRHL